MKLTTTLKNIHTATADGMVRFTIDNIDEVVIEIYVNAELYDNTMICYGEEGHPNLRVLDIPLLKGDIVSGKALANDSANINYNT